MKYIIGTIVVLIVLSIGAYFLADLWGYTLITPEVLKKSAITVVIVGTVLILLLILVPFFFKNNAKGYIEKHQGIAQPKKKP